MLPSISSSRPNLVTFQPPIQSRDTPKSQDAGSSEKQSELNSEPSTRHESRELSTQEQRQLNTLKVRDREVKTHEQAHLSAAGGLASGGANYTYQLGPDGTRYAVGGEVQIDTSAAQGDPAATLRKADLIRRAALAPAQPSVQDRSVAAQAAAMATQARADLIQQHKATTDNAEQTKSESHDGEIDILI